MRKGRQRKFVSVLSSLSALVLLYSYKSTNDLACLQFFMQHQNKIWYFRSAPWQYNFNNFQWFFHNSGQAYSQLNPRITIPGRLKYHFALICLMFSISVIKYIWFRCYIHFGTYIENSGCASRASNNKTTIQTN